VPPRASSGAGGSQWALFPTSRCCRWCTSPHSSSAAPSTACGAVSPRAFRSSGGLRRVAASPQAKEGLGKFGRPHPRLSLRFRVCRFAYGLAPTLAAGRHATRHDSPRALCRLYRPGVNILHCTPKNIHRISLSYFYLSLLSLSLISLSTPDIMSKSRWCMTRG
jgi:hypothetical protein